MCIRDRYDAFGSYLGIIARMTFRFLFFLDEIVGNESRFNSQKCVFEQSLSLIHI